jgi:hypothetical protein
LRADYYREMRHCRSLPENVFTAPGKVMVGERPRPFGEALGFDPMTATLIFGEHDAVLVSEP